MPRCTGTRHDVADAYREIKRVGPGPVVVMTTGLSLWELIKAALEEGAYAAPTKPVDPKELIARMRSITEQETGG